MTTESFTWVTAWRNALVEKWRLALATANAGCGWRQNASLTTLLIALVRDEPMPLDASLRLTNEYHQSRRVCANTESILKEVMAERR